MSNKNTIHFANFAQAAIWENELQGQLSDGAWENTSSRLTHFWWNCEAAVSSTVGVEVVNNYHEYQTAGKGFGFVRALITECDLSERMIFAAKIGMKIQKACHFEWVETVDCYRDIVRRSATDWHAAAKLARLTALGITEQVLIEAEAIDYTVEDLKKDLNMISKIMKIVYSSGTSAAAFTSPTKSKVNNMASIVNTPAPKSAAPAGKTFLMTGTLSLTRKQVETKIMQNGGRIASSASHIIKHPNFFLVMGDDGFAEAKHKKAVAVNANIITENDLWKMIAVNA